MWVQTFAHLLVKTSQNFNSWHKIEGHTYRREERPGRQAYVGLCICFCCAEDQAEVASPCRWACQRWAASSTQILIANGSWGHCISFLMHSYANSHQLLLTAQLPILLHWQLNFTVSFYGTQVLPWVLVATATSTLYWLVFPVGILLGTICNMGPQE